MVNAYIVYELDNSPINRSNNFPIKNCLFGTVKLTINAIKIKFVYNSYGIAFNGVGSGSLLKILSLVLTVVHYGIP